MNTPHWTRHLPSVGNSLTGDAAIGTGANRRDDTAAGIELLTRCVESTRAALAAYELQLHQAEASLAARAAQHYSEEQIRQAQRATTAQQAAA